MTEPNDLALDAPVCSALYAASRTVAPAVPAAVRCPGPALSAVSGEAGVVGARAATVKSLPPLGLWHRPDPNELVEFRRRSRAIIGLLGDCPPTLDNDRRSLP